MNLIYSNLTSERKNNITSRPNTHELQLQINMTRQHMDRIMAAFSPFKIYKIHFPLPVMFNKYRLVNMTS